MNVLLMLVLLVLLCAFGTVDSFKLRRARFEIMHLKRDVAAHHAAYSIYNNQYNVMGANDTHSTNSTEAPTPTPTPTPIPTTTPVPTLPATIMESITINLNALKAQFNAAGEMLLTLNIPIRLT